MRLFLTSCFSSLCPTAPPSAPTNLTALYHNSSTLLVTWEPPDDLGGRPEVTYRTRCEEQQQEFPGRWLPCRNQVEALPNWTGISRTRVAVTGIDPQHDYRVTVQACNDLSDLWGAAASASSATVAIHRCEFH